jgi:hypothetical protein
MESHEPGDLEGGAAEPVVIPYAELSEDAL